MTTTISINGQSLVIDSCGAIRISNGNIFVGGNRINLKDGHEIIIKGNCGSITCDGNVTVEGSVNGDVDCGGSCRCGDVSGSIDAGGSVSGSKVGGNIDAGGSVRISR